MERTHIINLLTQKNQYQSYLEIGLDDPSSNYNLIITPNKESVDPYFPDTLDKVRVAPPELTYHMTSDEMFAHMDKDKKYDIVFIDGLHERYQVYKDFINAFNHLNVGGAIVLHDMLPYGEEFAHFPRDTDGMWWGTSWQAVPELKAHYGFNIDVVDTDCGVGVFIKKYDCSMELNNYNGFEYPYNQIGNLLNIISEEDFFNKYIKD